MPNYNLVINSKFNPLTFQEMLYPFEKYGEAYKEQEEALAELGAKASVWDNMVDSTTDATSYNLINNYNTDLAAQRDAIANEGLSINSRRKLLDLRTRYGREIDAVEKAYNAREEVRKLQEQAFINSGGNTRFSTYANQQSIDAYLNGQRPDYYTANLNTIQQDAMNEAKAMASRYVTNTLANKGQYMDNIQTQGLSANEVDQIISNLFNDQLSDDEINSIKGLRETRNLLSDIQSQTGYESFNAADKVAINAAIISGIRTGLGYDEKHQMLQNSDYISASDVFRASSSSRSDSNGGSGGNEYYYVAGDVAPIMLNGSGSTIEGSIKYNNESKKYSIPPGFTKVSTKEMTSLTAESEPLCNYKDNIDNYEVYVKYDDNNNNIKNILLMPKLTRKERSTSYSDSSNHDDTGSSEDGSQSSESTTQDEQGGGAITAAVDNLLNQTDN